MIKKNLALALVDSRYAEIGSRLKIEYTVEYQRETVVAEVASTPFYNPVHKKA
jgi:glycine cleavage system aminomethyltransferase T